MNNSEMPYSPQGENWQNDMEKHLSCPDKYSAPSMNGIGLTKREYFAGLAMQGLLSNPSQIGDTTSFSFEWVASHAVGYADKLLKQLESNKTQ